MAKKKLAFYDAFRSQPTEQESPDESGSRNMGHVAYTPGDELTLRPKPKNINTSYHSASSQNIEVRAKGSSIPPGAARQWQQPQVNKGYLKGDGQIPGQQGNTPKAPGQEMNRLQQNLRPKVTSVPIDDDEEDTNLDIKMPNELVEEPVAPKVQPRAKVVAKPVSFQSETLPYLDPSDLETQNIPFPNEKPTQKVASSQNVLGGGDIIYLKPKVAVSLVLVWLASILLTFFIARGPGSVQVEGVDINGIEENIASIDSEPVVPGKERMDDSVDALKIIENLKNNNNKTETTAQAAVDNVKKNYTIRAVTVSDENRAKAFVKSLEDDGFKPAKIIRAREGILITVGEFASVSDAKPMLEKLKNKSISHWKPFSKAYVAKK